MAIVYLFCVVVLRFYTKNFKSFRAKMKAWQHFLRFLIWKLKIRSTLIAISCWLEAKFDYGYVIIFLRCGSKILHKKFQVILSKNKGVTLIFPIQNEIKIRKKSPSRLHFKSKWLEIFCVESKNHYAKKL